MYTEQHTEQHAEQQHSGQPHAEERTEQQRGEHPVQSAASPRFPVPVDAALRAAGWRPGRWDIKQAEIWADVLRRHTSPAGHQHAVFPAAVEAWAEFGGLHITPQGPGRHIAPATVHLDPMYGLHLARTLGDLGRALGTEVCPIGEETETQSLLAIDADGRVYSLDHSGDWYLGSHIDEALATLVSGTQPERLTAS